MLEVVEPPTIATPTLRWFLIALGWVGIAAGALCALGALGRGGALWIAIGLSSAISGLLWMAIAAIIELLVDIRELLLRDNPRLRPQERREPPGLPPTAETSEGQF
ncbi:MAG TPA: hypothetical protein VML55_17725 [Planctomycetaceae bacterium]|nr:hypothetical protein [Planctomycetaceae bacterium]